VAKQLQEAKMNKENIEITRRSVARKLDPDAFNTSTFVRSLLGYLVNERWTQPYIVDLRCSNDGMLMAYESESGTYLRLLCRRRDLIRAVLALADMVNLTPRERSYLLAGVPSPHRSQ
jgi:hypothetical protein